MDDNQYNEHGIGVALGGIQADVRNLVITVKDMKEDLKVDTKTLTERVNKIEGFMYKMAGILTFISIGTPIVIALVSAWITTH